ncbi:MULTISPECIES: hypothetical protein [unclassified Corallococcus]|uniref:hypothetical protein n=1 Tax=unclassified Corallococcus TaxID=2685029 RepID=UPI001A8E3AB3|nr:MULTISPECIES: hypothetical protein [unclassified Corallococcus]MBN9684324.1 hypothetical protein [Corallococcus sp. NCSPR001]WAS84196.1 hypothetical protein O0N60_33515 [Corallococcus sp. NCRR]
MKPGVALLLCTGLALTACGGAMTHEEATAGETTLATSEAALITCGDWVGWSDTGVVRCLSNPDCGTTWVCEPRLKADDAPSLDDGPQQRPPVCPAGQVAVPYVNSGMMRYQFQYRACYDEALNYTHTEYQYRNYASSCINC